MDLALNPVVQARFLIDKDAATNHNKKFVAKQPGALKRLGILVGGTGADDKNAKARRLKMLDAEFKKDFKKVDG